MKGAVYVLRCFRSNRRKLSEIKCEQMLRLLEELNRKVDGLMATADDLQQALGRITSATSNIATDVRSLHDQISALQAGQPVSQEQLDELTSSASSIADQLEGVAAETPEAESLGGASAGTGGASGDLPVGKGGADDGSASGG